MQPRRSFTTHPLRRDTAAVFASPHSGRAYPRAFLRRARARRTGHPQLRGRLRRPALRRAPQHGAPFVAATVPPRLYRPQPRRRGARPGADRGRAQIRAQPAHRLRARRHPAGGGEWQGDLFRQDSAGRGRRAARDLLAALSRGARHELDAAHAMFGQAILIDCHSMPHEAMDSVSRAGAAGPTWCWATVSARRRTGDRGPDRASGVCDAGFIVARNTPFAGAYVTRPMAGRISAIMPCRSRSTARSTWTRRDPPA